MLPQWLHKADFHQANWVNGLVLCVYPLENHRWKWEFRKDKQLLRCGTSVTSESAIRNALDSLDRNFN